MTRDEFYAMTKIVDYLPLTFETGRQKWTVFAIECSRCKKVVGEDDTRGFVVPLFKDSYREHVLVAYHVTADALCQTCNLLTPGDYVLHANMTLTGRDPRDGVERTWGMRRLTLWERFVDRFFGRAASPTRGGTEK